jgi:parvulin-like peptidyl-prolyl isomerase
MSFKINVSIALLLFGPLAQRNKPSPECDIVARVNYDVITRDEYQTALRDYRKELARQVESQQKNEQEQQDQIDLEFERTKSSVLDKMIEDFLLDQRANELGVAAEPEVIKAIEDTSMPPGYANLVPTESIADGAVDWQQARATHRRLMLHDIVIKREVLAPIYYAITHEDRRRYYESHKQEFMVPCKVSLSEIFLPFEDHSEAQVELNAIRLLVQLRAGADFAKAVKENTPKSRPSYAARGYLGFFIVRDLKPAVASAITFLKPGALTEPLRMNDGYEILLLDGRIPDSLRAYNDPEAQKQISRSITMSRADAARKDYIARLRSNADIKVCAENR